MVLDPLLHVVASPFHCFATSYAEGLYEDCGESPCPSFLEGLEQDSQRTIGSCYVTRVVAQLGYNM